MFRTTNPVPPVRGATLNVSIDARSLRTALGQVAFAAEQGADARPVPNAVLFEIWRHRLTLTAADNFQLSTKAIDLLDADEVGHELLLPYPAAVDLYTALRGVKLPVTLVVPSPGTVASFVTTAGTHRYRLVDETYPDYEQLFPVSSRCASQVRSAEIAALAFEAETIGADYLRLEIHKYGAKASATGRVPGSPTINQSFVGNPGWYLGDPTVVGLAPAYLRPLPILGPQLTVLLNGPHAPVVFSPLDDPRLRYLVMPFVMGAPVESSASPEILEGGSQRATVGAQPRRG
jgi:DNA polymerase III sliding clamp (beta) subunit (PCNA family)